VKVWAELNYLSRWSTVGFSQNSDGPSRAKKARNQCCTFFFATILHI